MALDPMSTLSSSYSEGVLQEFDGIDIFIDCADVSDAGKFGSGSTNRRLLRNPPLYTRYGQFLDSNLRGHPPDDHHSSKFNLKNDSAWSNAVSDTDSCSKYSGSSYHPSMGSSYYDSSGSPSPLISYDHSLDGGRLYPVSSSFSQAGLAVVRGVPRTAFPPHQFTLCPTR
ncbi:hypothetical protein BDZ89DRAFT_1074114 [Hymenopellis radicata]|nr:hypothetical protein BDZ89DRAFT_1074114 [Hymenopellis radicata]